jgi:hypothetical protein
LFYKTYTIVPHKGARIRVSCSSAVISSFVVVVAVLVVVVVIFVVGLGAKREYEHFRILVVSILICSFA